MITNPKKIYFETEKDIIDYVSKGIVPSRKNFSKVINGVIFPDNEISAKEKMGKDVVIKEGIIANEDKDAINRALNIVYDNRVKNRNLTILGMVGLFAAGFFIGSSVSSSSSNKNEESASVDYEIITF